MKRAQQPDALSFSFRLDGHSGVPVYRQLMDQVQVAVASGTLRAGDQLPTIRQVAVDLAINPNTVTRAYRELEIRGLLDSQQGTGTFIAERQMPASRKEKDRQLALLITEFVVRAGSLGFTVNDLVTALEEGHFENQGKR